MFTPRGGRRWGCTYTRSKEEVPRPLRPPPSSPSSPPLVDFAHAHACTGVSIVGLKKEERPEGNSTPQGVGKKKFRTSERVPGSSSLSLEEKTSALPTCSRRECMKETGKKEEDPRPAACPQVCQDDQCGGEEEGRSRKEPEEGVGIAVCLLRVRVVYIHQEQGTSPTLPLCCKPRKKDRKK